MAELVEFRKEREFGQILNDTFLFFKQNFKPLLKALMVYSGPFILLAAIATGYYQSSIFDITSFLKNFHFTAFFEKVFFNLFMVICASMLSYTMMILTMYSYIKLYMEKGKEGVEFEEIGRMIAKNFLKVFGSNILIFFMIMVGFMFCVIPGIYLAICLCLIYSALIFEDKSFANAISRSFSLAHSQFWWTLLLLLVIYLIVGFAGYIIALPQILFTFLYKFNSMAAGTDNIGNTKDLVLIITAIVTFINSLLGVIPFVAISLHYFSIVEKKEKQAALVNPIQNKV